MNRSQNIPCYTLLALILISLGCEVQEVIPASDLIESKKDVNPEEQALIYFAPIQYPSFPGGEEERLRFMTKHLKYPNDYKGCIEGRVYVQFLVTKRGKVTEAEIVKGLDKKLDKEALKVVKQFPDFIPGKIDGKPVPQRMIIPVYLNQ
ncbi:energy transducer TonB [Mangrovivirga sp. M17]|uniref:Energy transducer TonB n=1 Tax=Mangrovivirga halotolerans TaxID=2993936 RepID=A0ABT3RNG6_9BACT|nr:energy transducer TonB [Mangrovivirga halotolerans]MCX2742888.1 energy transducer TonB [Mangrovivirga halotolerans]